MSKYKQICVFPILTYQFHMVHFITLEKEHFFFAFLLSVFSRAMGTDGT